jgi:hypothetical protein
MVLLTTVADPVTARIVVAHLGAEGVVWQLRGNVDGPYPVGPVEVLVDEGDVALARDLLDASVVPPDDDDGGDPAPDRPVGADGRTWWTVVAAALVVAMLVVAVGRWAVLVF